jgi:hypothetical protein
VAVYCLDIHAPWRCHQTGACCRAGWAIPIEGPAYERVRLHFHSRGPAQRFITGTPMPEGAAAILATASGACVFYDGRLCDIHRELGTSAMPVACQQFPRIALRDGRGTFVTLSHFCPTAARLLLEADGGLEVVPAPSSLVATPSTAASHTLGAGPSTGASHGLGAGDTLEALDAANELPPLLRPGLLTDAEGYEQWERHCLRALSSDDRSAEQALDGIESATRRLVNWRPGEGPLAAAVSDAFGPATERRDRSSWTPADDRERFELARAAVPQGLAAPAAPDNLEDGWDRASAWWPAFGRAARRFAAARLFGSWAAYHGSSLLTIVRVVQISLSVLRVEAARQSAISGLTLEQRFIEAARAADLLLVHLADTPALVRAIETNENIRFRTLSSLRHNRHTVG